MKENILLAMEKHQHSYINHRPAQPIQTINKHIHIHDMLFDNCMYKRVYAHVI